jgi:hypothetical protein
MSEEKREYFSFKKEINEMRHGSGSKKVSAGLSALGKGLYNTGKYAVKEVLPKFIEATERAVEKQNSSKR